MKLSLKVYKCWLPNTGRR